MKNPHLHVATCAFLAVCCAATQAQQSCTSADARRNWLSGEKVMDCVTGPGLDGATVSGYDLAKAIASTTRPVHIKNTIVQGEFNLGSAAQLRTGHEQVAAYCAEIGPIVPLQLCRTDEEYRKLQAMREYFGGNAGVRTLSIDLEFTNVKFDMFRVQAEEMIIRGRLTFKSCQVELLEIGPAIIVRPLVFEDGQMRSLTFTNVLALDDLIVRGSSSGHVLVERSYLRKNFLLKGAKVGSLTLKESVIKGSLVAPNSEIPGLRMWDVRVGSDVNLQGSRLPRDEISGLTFYDSTVGGQIDLSNAQIDGDVNLGRLLSRTVTAGARVSGALK